MNISPWRMCFVAALPALLAGCVSPSPSSPAASADPAKAQITVLYDAFGKTSTMQKDWGYAALVEYGGKRILFDTGNNPDILAQNARAKGVDLAKLDFVVMSHRHGDHMGGMAYLLSVNPKVKIYAPKEGFGVYGGDLPSAFIAGRVAAAEQRYCDGAPPRRCAAARPGPARTSSSSTDHPDRAGNPSDSRCPTSPERLSCASCRSRSIRPTAWEVVGCSHPASTDHSRPRRAAPRINLVAGGFHLVVAKDDEIDKIAATLRDTRWAVAPGLHGRADLRGAAQGLRRHLLRRPRHGSRAGAPACLPRRLAARHHGQPIWRARHAARRRDDGSPGEPPAAT